MWKRLDRRGRDPGERVKEVGQLDAPRLTRELERCAVGVEGPPLPGCHLDAGGVLGGDKAVGDLAVVEPEDDVHDPVAMRLDGDDRDVTRCNEASDP